MSCGPSRKRLQASSTSAAALSRQMAPDQRRHMHVVVLLRNTAPSLTGIKLFKHAVDVRPGAGRRLGRLLEQAKQHICVDSALVGFIEDKAVVVRELVVDQAFTEQHAVRHVLDDSLPRVGAAQLYC